jgi:nucleoside-diphosphate-sugar epimerase
VSHSKSVLVTGSTGFVGQATASALERAGWDVVRTSRLKPSDDQSNIIHLDLADPSTVIALAKGQRYDAIVHIAAHVGWSDSDEFTMYVTNVLSTGYLAYLTNAWNAHIVYASSAIVHGVATEVIDSETPIFLDNSYAKSKWLSEELLKASNAKSCILRISGVFGWKGPTHLGLNRSIEMAIKDIPPKQVGMGSALRNYIYVKDVASAIAYALEHDLEGTHLLAGHEELSICEMLKKVCEVLSPSISPIMQNGTEAKNQLIKPSLDLPKTRSFVQSLIDIRESI